MNLALAIRFVLGASIGKARATQVSNSAAWTVLPSRRSSLACSHCAIGELGARLIQRQAKGMSLFW